MSKMIIPLPEFAFTSTAFNLGISQTADGERLTRERDERLADRAAAEQAQSPLPLEQPTPS